MTTTAAVMQLVGVALIDSSSIPYSLNEGDTALVVLGVLRGVIVGLLIHTSDGANGDIKNLLPEDGCACG